MKNLLYRAVLTILLFVLIPEYTKEQESLSKDFYTVGRFIIIKTNMGYQAFTGDKTSHYHKTMGKAINEII